MIKQNTPSRISARIVALVATGMTLPAAMDAVLGAGAYDQLAGDLWQALRQAEGGADEIDEPARVSA